MDHYYQRAENLIHEAGAEVAIGIAELKEKQQGLYSWLGTQVMQTCSVFTYSNTARDMAHGVSIEYAKVGVDVMARMDYESDAACILGAVWHQDEIRRAQIFSEYAHGAITDPIELGDIDAAITTVFDQSDNAEVILRTLGDQYFDSVMVDLIKVLSSAQQAHETRMRQRLVNLRLPDGVESHGEVSALELKQYARDYAGITLRHLSS